MYAPIGGEAVAVDTKAIQQTKDALAKQLGVSAFDLDDIREAVPQADEDYIRRMGELKKRSNEEFQRTVNATSVKMALPKEVQQQFNQLQSYQNLSELETNARIVWDALGDNKDAKRRYFSTNQPYINPSNDDVRQSALTFNKENRQKIGRDLNRYEYAGLKTLQIFNPELANQYVNELRTGTDWSGAKKTERDAVLERISLELEAIGRENTIRAATQTNEVMSYYEKRMKAAATPEEKQAIALEAQADPVVRNAEKVYQEVGELTLAESFDANKYPTLKAIDAVKAFDEQKSKGMSALDIAANIPESFAKGLGRYVEGTANTIETWRYPACCHLIRL